MRDDLLILAEAANRMHGLLVDDAKKHGLSGDQLILTLAFIVSRSIHLSAGDIVAWIDTLEMIHATTPARIGSS